MNPENRQVPVPAIDGRDIISTDLPPLPLTPGGLALFLDLDGTLLDLAPAPDLVTAEPGLADLLERIETRVSGALAIVTGRDVAFVDRLFPQHRFTVAGLHGAEIRPGEMVAGQVKAQQAPSGSGSFAKARAALAREAAKYPGFLTEDKGLAFALHYRKALQLHDTAARLMAGVLEIAGPEYRLRDGKCVIELCPSGSDKGQALRNIMAAEPFRSRLPLAVGDDLTDEAMFLEVNKSGGFSVRIGDEVGQTAARALVPTPALFRSWLHRLADTDRAEGARHEG